MQALEPVLKQKFWILLGVAIIMAQLGAYVPAASMELTVFDRIFTRIGKQR